MVRCPLCPWDVRLTPRHDPALPRTNSCPGSLPVLRSSQDTGPEPQLAQGRGEETHLAPLPAGDSLPSPSPSSCFLCWALTWPDCGLLGSAALTAQIDKPR